MENDDDFIPAHDDLPKIDYKKGAKKLPKMAPLHSASGLIVRNPYKFGMMCNAGMDPFTSKPITWAMKRREELVDCYVKKVLWRYRLLRRVLRVLTVIPCLVLAGMSAWGLVLLKHTFHLRSVGLGGLLIGMVVFLMYAMISDQIDTRFWPTYGDIYHRFLEKRIQYKRKPHA